MARRKTKARKTVEPTATDIPEAPPPASLWPLRKLRQTFPRWTAGGSYLHAVVYACECGHELECIPGAEELVDPTRCERCYWLGKLEQWNASIPNPLIRFDD